MVRSFCSLRSDFTDDFMDMLLHTQKCIDIYMKQSNRTSRFVVSILMSFHMLLPNSGSWSLALQVWSLALQVWSLALQVWSDWPYKCGLIGLTNVVIGLTSVSSFLVK